MPKILVYIATSLDGFVTREDGRIDWLPETSKSSYDAFYKSIDTVIIGKTTYDQVLTFGEYPYKDKKSFVFTRTSENNDDNVRFVSDIEKFVKDGFTGVEKNIWLVGGAKTIASFFKMGVVDEIITTVIPVLLGKGIHYSKILKMKQSLNLLKLKSMIN